VTGPPRCAVRTPVSAGRCTASDRTARLTRSGVSGITRRGLGPHRRGCEDGRRSRTMSINPVEEEDA
jgi:hypothetical protein